MWFLEGYLDGGERLWRTVIRRSPWTVGRAPSCDLPLTSDRVSSNHATLEQRGPSEIWLVDRGSLNGTFVNLERLTGARRLQEGDIVHFADQEFRLGLLSQGPASEGGQTTVLKSGELRSTIPGKTREFKIMLEKGNLEALLQPVVAAADGSPHAHELLGRGYLAGEAKGAKELFSIAESLGLATELSESLRRSGVREALPHGLSPLFVNTHPEELGHLDRLTKDLAQLRQEAPDTELVIEIHESAAADISALKQLRGTLAELRIDIAFDDFGTGQARLMELADATPKFVKFDVAWLADSDDGRRQALMGFLLTLCRDLGIITVAEGIETADQARMIRDMGFDLAQGYYFGRPAPLRKDG
jgi:EAL domain-containing protein (putative c-di-GMP-specific phosphodiesterase class I)